MFDMLRNELRNWVEYIDSRLSYWPTSKNKTKGFLKNCFYNVPSPRDYKQFLISYYRITKKGNSNGYLYKIKVAIKKLKKYRLFERKKLLFNYFYMF